MLIMYMALLPWIKTHKLALVFLTIILILLVSRHNGINSLSRSVSNYSVSPMMGSAQSDSIASPKTMSVNGGGVGLMPVQEVAPQPQAANRMVIQSSDMSLQVKNVTETRDQIINYAQSNGGYMVESNTSNPQDAPTATITVRVNAAKIKEALAYFRTLAVKVVSENLNGYDVTDQYVDIDKHIALLEATMAKFQSILAQAKEISDITNLNQQIISIQDQIDNYKGQQEYLKQNAALAKMTIYLATDELALPYAPSQTWRPEVIFKEAVRSMVADLRVLGSDIIWIGVYAVIWIPLGIVAYLIYRFMIKRNAASDKVTRKPTN